MRYRAIVLAAGLATLALVGCAVPGEEYAYDPYANRYYDPYSGRYYAYEPAYGRPYYYDQRYAYRFEPQPRWNYRDNSWSASRWDSSPYDRYERSRTRFERVDP
jgi:hypothetical protein